MRDTARGEAALKEACFRLIQSEPDDAEIMLRAAALSVGPYVTAGHVEDNEAMRALVLAAGTCGVAPEAAADIVHMGFIRAGISVGAASVGGRRLMTVADWAGEPIPERQWLVPDWLPMGAASVLYGDGGAGKSLLAQQLATAVASGSDFLGLSARKGPVLALLCEDDEAELKRRQHAILARTGVSWRALEDMRVMSGVGEVNLLMTFDARGVGVMTEFGERFMGIAEEMAPALVIIDTAADAFGGNENARLEVRQFMSALSGLAHRTGAAVLLLAHPSLTGLTNGRGHSGSTAWPNGARASLFLARPDPEGEETGAAPEPQLRLLTRRKANYASTGETLRLTWSDWSFERERPAGKPVTLNDVEDLCLKALKAVTIELRAEAASGTDAVTTGVTMVPMNLWRDRVYRLPLTASHDQNARRAAFMRGRKRLRDKGLVDFTDRSAWLT